MRTRSLLPYQLKALGFDPEKDCLLREDDPDGTGGHVYIHTWLSASSQPTEAQLEEVTAAAEALEAADISAAEAAAATVREKTLAPKVS